MSKSMNDMKKLTKYKAKFASIINDPKKQQIYLSKIQEYSSKLKHLGQFGGADELTELKGKFDELHNKIPNVDGVLDKAKQIATNSVKAKQEHDALIANFVNEIKRLHKAKHEVANDLKRKHDEKVAELIHEIEELKTEIIRLNAIIEDLRKPKPDPGPIILPIDPTIELRERITELEEQIRVLEGTIDIMKKNYSDLESKYNAYKALVDEKIIALGGDLDILKEESDNITDTINAVKLDEPIDANVRFPQIMYEIAESELLEIIRGLPVDGDLPEATPEIQEIVAKLKEGGKPLNTIKNELKGKLANNDRNRSYVNAYVV